MLADVLEIARPTPDGADATAIRELGTLMMIEAALFRIGRERSSFRWNDLRVTRGERVRLPQDAARLPGGLAEIATADAAEYKRWLGIDNADIRRDPRGISAFTPALERHRAPFRAQVIVASRVVVEPGAELHITGIPTVMIVEEFVFGGGRLFVSVPSHFSIGRAVGGRQVSKDASARGRAEPRTGRSEAKYQRQFAAGMGPRRQ
jgi:hypothetical protein